jgi:hypothetical protein
MAFLGAIFLGLGSVGMAGICCSAGMGWLLMPQQAPGPFQVLAVLGMYGIPLTAGILLIRAMWRIGQPEQDAGISLVVAAAAAFVGLAWIAVTAAVLLGGGLR